MSPFLKGVRHRYYPMALVGRSASRESGDVELVSYQVGIDLGTTYTAAATYKDGRAEIFALGNQAASIPSVVLLREDETVLTGESAVRRAISEPERVAREFKRRLGDTTPIIVGGSPYSAEALMAQVLRQVLAQIAEREGSLPEHIMISHPANWGPFKKDLLTQAVRMAGIADDDISYITEPEAAALSYASQERIDPGEILAVYDLGGGTFDAAVLRRTDLDFEIIGKPEGIERLGGIDFDAAVFAYVVRSLDGALEQLDPADPAAQAAVARLRQDCVEAKQALSSDTDAVISVLLPNVQTEVRITRQEFEGLIRPSLVDTLASLQRALSSADVTADHVSRVLLVGGSSRIPLISQLVSAEFGRPIAVDAHPKDAVALGAAYASAVASGAVTPVPDSSGSDESAAGLGAAGAAAAGAAAVVATSPPDPVPEGAADATGASVAPTEPEELVVVSAPEPAEIVVTPPTQPAAVQPTAPVPVVPPPAPTTEPAPGSPTSTSGTKSKMVPVLIGIVAVLALAAGAFFLFSGDDSTDSGGVDATTVPDGSTAATTTATGDETGPTDADIQSDLTVAVSGVSPELVAAFTGGVATLSGVVADDATRSSAEQVAAAVDGVESVVNQIVVTPLDEQCTTTIMSQPRWVCLDSAAFDGTTVTATYTIEDGGVPFDFNSTFHMHIFGSSVDPATAGQPGGASVGGGAWVVWDEVAGFQGAVADITLDGVLPEKLCVRVASFPDHTLESLDSGNCIPIVNNS